jgi:hypothetical protein
LVACTSSQLRLSLLRGGAIQHEQLAGLLFTNISGRVCTLRGFPAAQLVRDGKLLGSPALHQPDSEPTMTLVHGASAQATLTATTDCQAPLSDHVRVSPPGQRQTTDLADTLRGCSLSVGPVGPPS